MLGFRAEPNFAVGKVLINAAGSNGRCNTIWYKAAFKGGVYMKTPASKLQESVASTHCESTALIRHLPSSGISIRESFFAPRR